MSKRTTTGAERFVFSFLGADPQVVEQLKDTHPDKDWQLFDQGPRNWILQGYCRLAHKGLAVELSDRLHPDAINFAYASALRTMPRQGDVFVVSVRGDYPSVPWSNVEIVQNKTQVNAKSIWVPHWPQPGLIPRDPERGTRVERVGYLGREVNHYTRIFRRASGTFKVRQQVRAACQDLGLEFVEKGPEDWNDFSDIDVAIGLRAFGNQSFDTKPATKLVNAWLAGTVFIGGADSAFLQVGAPELDYIRATTPNAFARGLRRLKENAGLFSGIVARGRQLATLYNTEQVANNWQSIMDGEIAERFRNWQSGR